MQRCGIENLQKGTMYVSGTGKNYRKKDEKRMKKEMKTGERNENVSRQSAFS